MNKRLEDQSVYYEPILVEKITRNVFMARTKFWVGDNSLRISVEQTGRTEEEAKNKLINFLNNPKGETI